eukprot:4397375-Amphidinium_carterae.1
MASTEPQRSGWDTCNHPNKNCKALPYRSAVAAVTLKSLSTPIRCRRVLSSTIVGMGCPLKPRWLANWITIGHHVSPMR